MMRLVLALCTCLLVRQVDAFRPIDCVGRSVSICRDQSRQVRNWGISFALDDADASLEGDMGSLMDDDTEVAAPVPKKKAPKRKPKASAAVPAAAAAIVNESAIDAVTSTTSIATPVTAPAANPTPATVPSKIYYRAKEDTEIYAVSSISIDTSVVTLKDLKKLLVDANEWPESSRVIFYSGDERLAFTTTLSECLLDNTAEKPLSVTVLTSAAISEVPIMQQQQECKSTMFEKYDLVFSSILMVIRELTIFNLLLLSSVKSLG